ncbi:CHAD domain-containing protein [Haloechinothrix halophila]|uniref:CHAD domain-containing protein n=1 Tax=Haloechinothrix halophila TaxID=1069073 RepID=UPI0006842B49|nr:CHAD domain-containing protein [Haloechinothrix halophila]
MTSARGQRRAPAPAEVGLGEQPQDVSASTTTAEHARARIDQQLRALLSHQDGARAGTDPEELHQFRVAIRRLRSVLKTVPSMTGEVRLATDTPPEQSPADLRDELRWLGDVTSPVRDLDVLLMRLREETAGFDEDELAAAEQLMSALVKERGTHRIALGRALSSARYQGLLTGLAALANGDGDGAQAPMTGTKLVSSLRKPYQALRKAIDELGDDPEDDQVHALRIKGKRLRYAAETALPAAKKSDVKQLGKLIKAAKRLQDVLGEHQDAVVAAQRVRELGAAQEKPLPAFVAGRLVEREMARKAQARANLPGRCRKVLKQARPLV